MKGHSLREVGVYLGSAQVVIALTGLFIPVGDLSQQNSVVTPPSFRLGEWPLLCVCVGKDADPMGDYIDSAKFDSKTAGDLQVSLGQPTAQVRGGGRVASCCP